MNRKLYIILSLTAVSSFLQASDYASRMSSSNLVTAYLDSLLMVEQIQAPFKDLIEQEQQQRQEIEAVAFRQDDLSPGANFHFVQKILRFAVLCDSHRTQSSQFLDLEHQKREEIQDSAFDKAQEWEFTQRLLHEKVIK